MALSRFFEIASQVLGVGSYGKVYKAKYGQLPCAAKLLHDTMFEGGDPGRFKFAEKFEQECQFLSMIKHPNIVQYLGTSKDFQAQRLALLMELMDESLTKFLERSAPGLLSYHIQLNICHDVALALSYLHSNNIIHRDLSSNNVLLIGEGVRAKVTDFGISKLIDMNPRMTPLTQCPGATVYMPPEALTTPPHYSSKLDCFSHGVLTIQIITRNFPMPGDATTTIEDERFPTGRVVVFVPEAERRKKDIMSIKPDHPLLPIALNCVKDRDTERPSADDVCERLANLKMEEAYKQSTEQAKQQATLVQKLRLEIEKKDQLVTESYEQLREERRKHQKEMKEKEEMIEQIFEDCHQSLQGALGRPSTKLPSVENKKMPKDASPVSFSGSLLKLTWKKGDPAPHTFKSGCGRSAAYGKTAYFSYDSEVFSFTLPECKWSKLPTSKYKYFSLAVIRDKLTTIGGCEEKLSSDTNILLSLKAGGWKQIFPQMPTRRRWPAIATTSTYLVVAGGWKTTDRFSATEVEVLNTVTLQWIVATNSLPLSKYNSWMVTCEELLYLRQGRTLYFASVDELLGIQRQDSGFSWTRIADIPVPLDSSLLALNEHLLAIGGKDGQHPTATIYCHDRASDVWRASGKFPTPQSCLLTAVLASNQMIVVGEMRETYIGCGYTQASNTL